jgi:hypothetical protein
MQKQNSRVSKNRKIRQSLVNINAEMSKVSEETGGHRLARTQNL